MRAVHPYERLNSGGQLFVVGLEQLRIGERDDLRGYPSSRLVLRFEGVDEVDHDVLFLEDREDVFLFVLFVVLLDKLANQPGSVVEDVWGNLFLASYPAETLFVDEEAAVEHA